MCDICRNTPCHYRCPNAKEPEIKYTCAYCNEGIEAGEEYYSMEGKRYHMECLEDSAYDILQENFDIDRLIA